MAFDQTAPSKLKGLQLWFAGIITRPIDCNSRMAALSPAGVPMEIEASDYITPSPTLKPEQRIELYNQQYWWRLLNTLQESFPLVARLFGYSDFNHTIGFPYLVAHPPCHWSLNNLGEFMAPWIESNYHASDKKLVYDAARLDWAYSDIFVALQKPFLKTESHANEDAVQKIFLETLYLQPYVYLLQFDYDIYKYRNEFLKKEPEYWIDSPFPPLEKRPLWSVLYRGFDNNVHCQEITQTEYLLLELFHKGSSIEECCEWLEEQSNEATHEASEQLPVWIQRWIAKQWLYKKF